MNEQYQKVSVIVLTYNSQRFVSRCLESIKKQDLPAQVIVVDNGSTDGTIRLVRSEYPFVQVIELGENFGYAVGNNRGIEKATSEIVVVLNPDVVLLENALYNLIQPVITNRRSMTTPLVLLPDFETVNVSGLLCNPLGFSFPRGLGERPSEYENERGPSGISGCCFAIRKEVFGLLGGFDERFFMYNEDTDLSWKAHLMNIDILAIDSSRVCHTYDSGMTLSKLTQLERNRYLILRKHMPVAWFLILLPSLVVAEFVSFAAFLRLGKGGVKAKIEAWASSAGFHSSKLEGDFRNLREKLHPVFPLQPRLTSSPIEATCRRVIEIIFRFNWALVRLLP